METSNNSFLGILIIIVCGAFFYYLNRKLAGSDNKHIRTFANVSMLWAKIRFGLGVVMIIFVLCIFAVLGSKKK